MACLYMKKYIAKLFVLAGLLVGIMLLFGITALAEDPLSASMEISPKALTGTGSVRVSINVVNTSDGGSPISVTLLDPAGNVCSGFGSGGTANLAPGSSASYSGSWTVTQAQLEAGRVTFTARYAVPDEAGVNMAHQRPISASITHNTAKALLHVERFVSPGAKVVQGQTVEIRYSVKNVGTIDVSNITIKDSGITNDTVTHPLLAVGDTTEMSYSYTAGSTSKTTHADISYEYEINGKKETSKAIKADPPVTIDVTVPDLIVQLTGQQIVNAGAKVDLTYVITNKSDLSYEQLKITDKILGDIDSNLSIGPGKSHQNTKSITVNQQGTYQFTVVGVDSTGNNVIFQSNELTIQTTDTVVDKTNIEQIPVVLDIIVEADRDVIYEEPSIVRFRIKVTNNGADPAQNVVIAAAGKTVREIDRIEPGETVDLIMEFEASMGGQFQFTASAKDNTGADASYESNIFPVAYKAIAPPPTPTPIPTAAPTDTPEPQATEDPALVFQPPADEGGRGSVVLYILAGVLVLIVASVGVLFFVEQRRGAGRGKSAGSKQGGQIKVIDSIQRTPHRDYARAPKRGAPANVSAKRAAPPVEETEPAYVPKQARQEIPVYDDIPDMPDEPYEAAKPAVVKEPEPQVVEDVTSVYRRPETQPKPMPVIPMSTEVEDIVVATSVSDQRIEPEETTSTASMDDTAVYSRNYLSRIQQGAKQVAEEAEEYEEEALAKPKLSEEDAALLSGSTGQYRLSRRSASVRSVERQAAPNKVEDPEEFARKQRASRSSGRNQPVEFYEDDDGDENAPVDPKKRRR